MESGSWTLLEKRGKFGLYRCECGAEKVVNNYNVASGRSRSCRRCSSTDDGRFAHPLYDTWKSMRRRCTDPNWRRYDRYGGRGIRVCDRWLHGEGGASGFTCFAADVGERPPGTSLDRIDNDGHYEPGNVRWATQSDQMRNTSVSRRAATHITPGYVA
jgi:hypothetical protein